MVYVDPKNLGYEPYWTKWVSGRVNKQEQKELMKFYEKYVPALIDMVLEGIVDGKEEKRLKTIVPLTNLNMVSQKSKEFGDLRNSTILFADYTSVFYTVHDLSFPLNNLNNYLILSEQGKSGNPNSLSKVSWYVFRS